MRRPGIEPGPPAWKAGILTTELSTPCRLLHSMRVLLASAGPRGAVQKKAFDGIRTRDLSLTKRVLCQLSYEGANWRIRVSIPVPRRC